MCYVFQLLFEAKGALTNTNKKALGGSKQKGHIILYSIKTISLVSV